MNFDPPFVDTKANNGRCLYSSTEFIHLLRGLFIHREAYALCRRDLKQNTKAENPGLPAKN